MKNWPKLAVAALATLLLAAPAQAGKDVFVVDLTNDPASLDPHGQWNPDSHRKIWINAHIKGPDGAPLLHGEKVAVLAR